MRLAALVASALLVSGGPALAAFAANDLNCTVYTPAKPGLLARCDAPFSGPGDAISIELRGAAPNKVNEVRLRFAGHIPGQSFAISAEPVIDLETVGILFMDFNFDGVEDLAVMEFLPAGPNVPYLYFLFDKSAGRFVENEALAAITSPDPRPKQKQIRSHWRASAAVSGTDIFAWRKGELVKVARDAESYEAGECVRMSYRLSAGSLKLTSQGACE